METGVDLIKSYEMLTPEAFAAVLERAKEQNKIVTGHVPLSMDVVEASNLGLRSMEHMRNLEMSISPVALNSLAKPISKKSGSLTSGSLVVQTDPA